MVPQLRVYDYVDQPFARVAEALSLDTPGIIQRATTAASERARDLGGRMHAQIGPIDLTAPITVEIGPMDDTPMPSGRDALRVPVKWHAKYAARAFPVMQAEITVCPLTANETQLELAGTYAPPLGPIGRMIDSYVLHRIAEASVLQLVQAIARYLREDLRAHAHAS